MKKLVKIILLGVLLCNTSVTYSQGVTKSAMNGQIVDANGAPLPGANVVAIHLPTSTKYGSATDFDGFFRIANMRPGGPYSVIISYVGFKDLKEEGISLTLGQTKTINRALSETASALEEVTITAFKNDVFDSNRTGAKTTITERDLSTIPAASRSIADFVRATPQAQITEGNDGFSISLGGQNNRFNSVYVDGAVSNDVFGLAGSGTDGGQTGANPFSIDAIEQLQVQLAPFDVKISGFTGGAVNAITRSGSNEIQASAYSFLRNESLVGKTPTVLVNEDDGDQREKLDQFNALTYGVRVGGPIVKDKLFYFINVERQDNETPQPFNVSNYGGNLGFIPNPNGGAPIYDANIAEAGLELFRQRMISDYGYDPGVYNNNPQTLKNNLITTKLDWNINNNNDFSITYRLQNSDNLEARNSSNGNVRFLNGSEEFVNNTHAINLQLNSSIGRKYANSLSVGYKAVRDDRDPSGNPFPTVEIQDGNGDITFGSEPFSTANLLNQDVVTITNNFEIFSGKHNFTLGLHNEYASVKNLFFAYNFGFYSFENQFDDMGNLTATGLEQFLNNQGSDFYQHGYSLLAGENVGDESSGASKFDTYQFGVYFQDQITFSERFKLSLGIRFDVPYWTSGALNDDFNDRTIPLLEAEGKDLQNASVGRSVNTIVHTAPRVGFNWDVKGDNTTQVRGGVGVFTSRLPLVWPGGTYNNNGVTGGFTQVFGGQLFNPNANTQFKSVTPGTGGVGGNIDLFAPDFKLPQVLKTNLAFDQKLPFWGLITSVDFIYNENINAIYYENLNLKGPVGFLNGADNRPYYDRRDEIDDAYGRIILASNTSEGNSWNGAITIRKPYDNGFSGQVSYSYGDANAIFDGTSSQNSSQWRGIQTVNGKNSDLSLSRSDFAQGHRISSNLSYELKWNDNIKTTLGFFYNGSQGRPFSYTYREGTDLLNDDSRDNALMYVPATADEITLVDSDGDGDTDNEWSMLNAYIENDDYLSTRRGKYAERNGSMGPWSHILDLKFLQDISFNTSSGKKQTLQASLDIFNFTNLINKDWGVQRFASSNTSILQTQTAAPDPVFSLNNRVIEDGPDLFDDSGIQSSRWQMQVGLRYSFN